MSAVGGFVNYSPGSGGTLFTIAALAADNSVIESYIVSTVAPISTTGTDDGAFRGILLASPVIAAFTITGEFGVLDDLTYSRAVAAVPEPNSLTIGVLLALGSVAIRRRLPHRPR